MYLRSQRAALHDLPFRVFAPLDLRSVRQVEGLLALVEVDEVHHAQVAQLVHHVPGVVLGNRDLVQLHVF